MAAWQREREKIRSSRFFEEAEVQPYERKQFEQIEIRAGKISNEIKLSNGSKNLFTNNLLLLSTLLTKLIGFDKSVLVNS
jgi:hypothetical protein